MNWIRIALTPVVFLIKVAGFLFRILRKISPKTWFKIALIPLSLGLLFYMFTLAVSAALSRVAVLEFLLMLAPREKLSGTNVLVVGIDDTDKVQRADTIMVMHLDAEKNRIGVLSVPRDTRLQIPNVGWTKINHAYAYGGMALTKKTVSEFLKVPIDYYIKVDLSGVESLIDQVGGVTVQLSKDMYYRDQAGDLYIDLKHGKQTLSGRQAVQYLRFRHDADSDIGRIQRQQAFVQAFAKKVLETGKTTELPVMLSRMSRMIDTDMSARQIAGLAIQFREAFSANRLDTGTLVGTVALIDGVSYWRPDLAILDRTVGRVLMGFGTEEQKVVSTVKTVDKSASQEARRNMTLKEVTWFSQQTDLEKPKQYIKQQDLSVEILNGYGSVGEAHRLAAHLKQLGVDVRRTGNAGSFGYKNTMIVDWKGQMDASLALAQVLSIDPTKIIVYDRPEKTLDLTIVLGRDWTTSKRHIYEQKLAAERKQIGQ